VGRRRRAPASRQSDGPASWLRGLLPGVLARASVRVAANGAPGSVADCLTRAGCGSGQAWLLRPLGSRAPGTGPIVTSLARSAIRSPHLSPIVMSGSGRLRGSAIRDRIDRGTTSSIAVQRGGPAGRGPLGLRLGLCAPPWRVAAHVVAQPYDKSSPICRYSLRWRDPDSNRGHHDFQGVAGERSYPRRSCKSGVSELRHGGAMPLVLAGLARVWDFIKELKSQRGPA
jgi:hypothetical protein